MELHSKSMNLGPKDFNNSGALSPGPSRSVLIDRLARLMINCLSSGSFNGVTFDGVN